MAKHINRNGELIDLDPLEAIGEGYEVSTNRLWRLFIAPLIGGILIGISGAYVMVKGVLEVIRWFIR